MKSVRTTIYAAGIALGLLATSPLALAQQDYKPTEENLQAREAFRDKGFGIFLH